MDFGLGDAVWSTNEERAIKVAEQLAADADDPVGAGLGKIIRALPEHVGRQAAAIWWHSSAAPDRGAVRPGAETTSALVAAVADQRGVSIGYRSTQRTAGLTTSDVSRPQL